MPSKAYFALLAICALASFVPRGASAGNVTVDGRFSPAQALSGPNYAISANLGKQVGSNLFHSFGQFSLVKGDTATFSGPAAISNVISRVTGGSQSSIDGAIRSTITGANLYLINPSGMVFGPNATVNVSGSFHASTADYLKMSDGAKFQATNPDGSTLSAAPPAAFGFLNASPAKISVNGSTLGPVPGTLGLVGGPVSITGATLSAPAGTIHVTSVAGTGEVPVDPRNTQALTVTSFGPVAVNGGSKLDVSNPGGLASGGSVFIRSGALTIDASEINADNFGSGAGGTLFLRGDSQVALTNGASVHSAAMGNGGAADIAILTTPAGIVSADASMVETGTNVGGGGSVSIVAGELTLQNGANILAQSFGTGTGGAVAVSVGGPLTVNSGASLGTLASANGNAGGVSVTASGPVTIDMSVGADTSILDGIGSLTEGRGNAGNVTVGAATMAISNYGLISSFTTGAGSSGDVSVGVSNTLSIAGPSGLPKFDTGIFADALGSSGNAGKVTVTAGTSSIVTSGEVSSTTFGSGTGGSVSVTVDGQLTIDGKAAAALGVSPGILSDAGSTGDAGSVTVKVGVLSIANAGQISSEASPFKGLPPSTGSAGKVSVSAGTLSMASSGEIRSSTFAFGNAGSVTVTISGQLTIDGSTVPNRGPTAISSQANFSSSRGAAGSVSVSAGTLSILNSGAISSSTFGAGKGGDVFVTVAGALSIDGMGNTTHPTGIFADANPGSTGSAGTVIVSAATLSISNRGEITTSTSGPGAAGSIRVSAGTLSMSKNVEISSSTFGSGNGGDVSVNAGTLTINPNSEIAADTFGAGKGGDVTVGATGALSIDGALQNFATGIFAEADIGSGNAGEVKVNAGSLSVSNGGLISTAALGFGNAGNVTVNADSLSIVNTGEIRSSTFGPGNGGSVVVNVAGLLLIGGPPVTGIIAQANPSSTGNAGSVTVSAGSLTIANNGEISSATFGPGSGGSVSVMVGGQLTITGTPGVPVFTGIASNAAQGSTGNAGTVTVGAGTLSILNGGAISSDALGASGDLPASTGSAGQVTVTAGALTIASNGAISSATFGSGNGGNVSVGVTGQLSIEGTPGNIFTGITATSQPGSTGNAGSVVVSAGAASIVNNKGEISSSTFGSGNGGTVSVDVAGLLSIDGGSATVLTGIAAQSSPGTTGNAGSVIVNTGELSIVNNGQISVSTQGSGAGGNVAVAVAGPIALGSGAQVTAATTGAGNGGSVQVTAHGPLTLSDPGSGIVALASSTASGNAGSVTVTAPQIALTSGAEISSSTAGTGAGGSVNVATPGTLLLDGGAEIAASATGPESGQGGDVTVAAGTLTVQGGAQIASSTAGRGKGGNVDVTVASDITLPDPGPQITAQSTGSGDAGSVTVSAFRLQLGNGAAISTEAQTSTASGGNITLKVDDFLFLTSSKITTSVKGETGNGGNIVIDPQSVVLNHSSIIAQAIEGHGGDITITADEFIKSADSVVSATSELGISGTIEIIGPRVDFNGLFVVLPSELRTAAAVLRNSCAAQSGRPQSSLTEAGRGGLPQDPEATLPALYIAGRDMSPTLPTVAGPPQPIHTERTTARLTVRCG